jgi:hypothetical protein
VPNILAAADMRRLGRIGQIRLARLDKKLVEA